MSPMCVRAIFLFIIGYLGGISAHADTGDCSVCGVALPVLRRRLLIRYGDEIPDTRNFPWMVSLRYTPYFNNCGGAILDEYFILTAAHCVTNLDGDIQYDAKVYFQTKSVTQMSRGAAIEKFIIHPKYKLEQSNATDIIFAHYDIALVKLKQKIECNMYKRPICLPSPDLEIPTGKANIVAGWGTPYAGIGGQTLVLQYATVKHLDFEECIEGVPETEMIRDHNLCYGGTNQTVCYGDSGSPLVDKINSKYTVVGVLSCETDTRCLTTTPFIYVNVAKFVNWIKEQQKTFLRPNSSEEEESKIKDQDILQGGTEKEIRIETKTEVFPSRKWEDLKIFEKETSRVIRIEENHQGMIEDVVEGSCE